MAVHDCTLFFNEFDILLLRLVELSPVVDRFVIVEADRTFQGQRKPLLLSSWPAELEPFRAQVELISVELPPCGNPWATEYFLRDAVMRGVASADPQDIVIISDVDEIPRRRTVERLTDLEAWDVAELQMIQLIYGFSWQDGPIWRRARAVRRAMLDLTTPQELRMHPYPTRSLSEAGWHFTNFFPQSHQVDRIRDKMHAVAHTELLDKGYDNRSYLELCVRGGSLWSSQPPFSRPLRYRSDLTDGPHVLRDPAYASRFRDYICPQSGRDRTAELRVRSRYAAHRLARAGRPWKARVQRAAHRLHRS